MAKRVEIIGSGIGGIASAIQLASRGYNVNVFEKNNEPGGKLGELKTDGFRFDTGPSVFTMPELVDELFQIAGKNPRDFFEYAELEQSCKYFFEDGTVINAQQNINEFAKELNDKIGEQPENLFHFLNKSKTIYDLTSGVFVFKSIHDRKNLFRKQSLNALFNFNKIDALRTMHEANLKYFSKEKVIRLFDRYATYNGSDPYKAPATLNIIPHLEHNKGTYFPKGGMYTIIEAIYELAKEMGVKFYFNNKVEKVEYQNKKITAIETANGKLEMDYLVSDIDVQTFYSQIFKDEKLLKKNEKHEKSSSALIFYWGINSEFPDLKLHNILFAEDYKEEFKSLFERKEIYKDPTVYIYISSKQVPEDAPAGKENWYVMINAPENVGQDWEAFKEQARTSVINKINRILNTDIENFIEFEK